MAKRKKVDEIKPISGLDIEALLAKGVTGDRELAKKPKLVGRIGTDDPANDFKKLIDDEENDWKPVFKEMEKVIRDVVSSSFADASYDKAIKAIRAYRAESIDVLFLLKVTNSSSMNLCDLTSTSRNSRQIF